QTETEATGAPQKHHYTLNQQVGSITRSSMRSRPMFFAISPITEKLAMTLIFAFAGKVKSKKSIDVVRMHKDIKPGFLIK
ncbi:hypothetical protein, partial [Klebsiella pneumoniae]|uniref:hypothetical protein n=1 Tax=Klebsiella pneumoniae TaxID=573 RepID=UPI001F4BC5DD